MPRAPEVRTSLPSEGSVGRLRINAPVEAFGGGAAAQGLADVGRGLQSVGQGVQDIQAARERKQRQETAFKADRSMLDYRNSMNQWIAENKDNPDYEATLESYAKHREQAKQNAMKAAAGNPEAEKALSLMIDESESSYRDMVMNDVGIKQRAARDVAMDANYAASEEKLFAATDDLTRADGYAFDLGGWMDSYGNDYKRSLEVQVARVAPELRDERRKELLAQTMGKLFNGLGQGIATHPAPEDYMNKVDSLVEAGVEQGLFTTEQGKELKDLNKKRFGARLEAEDKRNVRLQKEWLNTNLSWLAGASNNPAQRQLLLDEARLEAGKLGTRKDPTGKLAFEKLQNANAAYDAERQTANALMVEETLYDQGRDAAEAMLQKLEAGRTFKTKDGKTVTVRDINGKQAARLRAKFEKQEDVVRRSWKSDAVKRLRKLSEAGKLYSFQRETRLPSGEGGIGGFVAEAITTGVPNAIAGRLVDDEFEPLWDESKPEEGLQVGESLSFFNRGMPYAADWDQHQIQGKNFEELMEYMDKWADMKNVTSKTEWDQHLREVLIPLEKEAAMMNYERRLFLDMQELRTTRDDITKGLYERTKKEMSDNK